MSTSQRRYFRGDTVEQAVVAAACHYDVEPEELAYRIVDKRHGFLKIRRKVVIEVDPEAPSRPREQAHPSAPTEGVGPVRRDGPGRGEIPSGRPQAEGSGPPAGQARGRHRAEGEGDLISLPQRPLSPGERLPRAEGQRAEGAERALDVLLRFARLDISPTILEAGDHLEVDLKGRDEPRLVEQEGRLLLAVEHLLPRVLRGVLGESIPCRVDCDNFHEIREEQLRDLAQRVAAEVRRKGRPRRLEPMNPADRRIVHLTLTHDPAVVTESQGEGYYKRITVRPA